MNFLCHWLFSEPTPDALMGSLWPDFARRPDPETVSETFMIHFDRHQWLDRETDTTPLLEPLRQTLRPKLRKTTPIVVDMLIDHHLAKHWSEYHGTVLSDFARSRYLQLARFNGPPVPRNMNKTLKIMTEQDWLTNYRFESRIQRSLVGMSRRINFANPLNQEADWAVQQESVFSSAIQRYIERQMMRVSLVDR